MTEWWGDELFSSFSNIMHSLKIHLLEEKKKKTCALGISATFQFFCSPSHCSVFHLHLIFTVTNYFEKCNAAIRSRDAAGEHCVQADLKALMLSSVRQCSEAGLPGWWGPCGLAEDSSSLQVSGLHVLCPAEIPNYPKACRMFSALLFGPEKIGFTERAKSCQFGRTCRYLQK